MRSKRQHVCYDRGAVALFSCEEIECSPNDGARSLTTPFRAPEPLPIINPSDFVPRNGFPVVKGLSQICRKTFFFLHDSRRIPRPHSWKDSSAG